MDAVEYLKQRKRMCDTYYSKECANCSMFNNNGCRRNFFERYYFKDAVDKIETWAEGHPIYTNADKFRDIFGMYATEMWAMPEVDFLKWLNTEVEK